jgi:multimeric flavodoxin WrbA
MKNSVIIINGSIRKNGNTDIIVESIREDHSEFLTVIKTTMYNYTSLKKERTWHAW